MPNYRPDHQGEHRTAFDKNRRKLLATQDTCAICGRPIDKTLPPPHPLSPCVDHIIPVSRGGHPSDIDNLQLVHFTCNRMKADRLMNELKQNPNGVGAGFASGLNNDNSNINQIKNKNVDVVAVSNRNLPLSLDWKKF